MADSPKVPLMRACTKCGEIKLREAFSPREAGKDGINSICRACINRRTRERRDRDPNARAREREYERRPEVQRRARARHVERLYGIDGAAAEMMEEAQGGACALCYREAKLVVDHDHETHRVRGLLCYPCNIALGQARDNPELLRRMADYVENHTMISEVSDEEWAAILNA